MGLRHCQHHASRSSTTHTSTHQLPLPHHTAILSDPGLPPCPQEQIESAGNRYTPIHSDPWSCDFSGWIPPGHPSPRNSSKGALPLCDRISATTIRRHSPEDGRHRLISAYATHEDRRRRVGRAGAYFSDSFPRCRRPTCPSSCGLDQASPLPSLLPRPLNSRYVVRGSGRHPRPTAPSVSLTPSNG